ncbi:hypothetical protein F4821DRAFT_253604 [Hypoxylon rubiginosum]|uniref:Uncharacterized protein n=1 Tax=Hypoxylon rubiginosum TaxID=110542 RepID=A0ACC0DKC0_9PEZI|nr:hypothetical protein F4821DRAFT_253604 [Hypoxylon rubiginosum]
MSKDLRVKLGKHQVESQRDHHSPWKPEVWNAAIEAYRAGWRPPEPRFPVVINSSNENGPLDSAETLQKLIGLPSAPKVTKTKTTDITGSDYGDEVQVADVSWEQLLVLRERTEYEETNVWFLKAGTDKFVPKNAWVVKSIKEEFRDIERDSGEQGSGEVEDGGQDEKAASTIHDG